MARTAAAHVHTAAHHRPTRRYDVVALQVPIAYNRHGDHDHDGLIFALRRNYDHLDRLGRQDARGNPVFHADQPDPLVRPLVLRACVGETLRVSLTNRLQGRRVGLHLVGDGYDVQEYDGARVGGNRDSTLPPYEDGKAPPQRDYVWRCVHEGVYVFHDAAELGGTEDGSNLHGLFGVLVVEPAGTIWRTSSGQALRADGDEPRTSADGEVDGLYVDVIPQHPPKRAPAPWLSTPPKYPFDDGPENPTRAAFREFVIVFHDEPEIVNHTDLMRVLPPWGAEPEAADAHGGHAGGVSHVMPVSYRAEPMPNRERLIWSRLTGTPVSVGDPVPAPLEVPVVNEEQHHSSWLFGDPATPILRAYLGDPVRIRLVHCGVKETHVYHLHLYAWHADPANHAAPLIDAITLSPQTGHTIEPLYGAGNRQLVPGDVIWHCHLYPHFHHGMWGLLRTYDRRHDLPLPDPARPWLAQLDPPRPDPTRPDLDESDRPGVQCYPDGTPIPPLLPLPDREPPPAPTGEDPGWPRFMRETREGDQLPGEALDRAGRPRQKSPRVPWIWDGEGVPEGVERRPLPAGFDYRPATDAEKAFFFQHRGEQPQPGTVRNADPEPGWLTPYLAFADGDTRRVPRHLEVLREPFLYNRHGWHDPRGHRYRQADPHATDVLTDAALRAGAATRIPVPPPGQPPDPVRDPQPPRPPQRREPAFFRAHHGDPVALTLHNRIAYPIPGDAFDHALPRPGVPGLWECGLHVHMVKFDVVCADGASSGWNYLSAPRPGYRLDYKWWADEEFGVIFTHDHLFANYRQKRGLFGAMLVEPAGTVWLDPWRPDPHAPAIFGEQAVIVRPDGRAFRELALGGLDFVPLHGADGGALNPPVAPTSDGDQGGMGINYRSAPLRERPGDPSTWFASLPHDPDTPLLHAYPGEPLWLRLLQGAHEELHSFAVNGMRWRRFRDDPDSPLRSQQTMGLSEAFTFTINEDGQMPYGVGDHLWRQAGIDDTWLGCWGLLRVHPEDTGQLPSLAEAAATVPRPADGALAYQPPPPPDAAPAPPVRRYTVEARRVPLAYRDDLVDRFGLVYAVTGGTTPDGEPLAIPATAAPDTAEPPGTIAPLVLRCLAGEAVEVTLHNALPADLAPEPFAPAVPIDLAAGVRTVSRRVSLHADLVRTDVARDDGSRVGRNPDSTIPPGGARTYRWYTDGELGPVPLYDLADVRNHRHHGLIGALIVEPRGAVPIDVAHRHEGNKASVPLDKQAWTGVQAVIRLPTPSAGHEEIVLVLQDGLRLFLEDNLAAPFPDIPADPGDHGVDPEDQGQKAINYRSNPTGPQRGWLRGTPSRAAHYHLPPNTDVRVHLLGGFDKPRNHSLNVHGMAWPEWPHRGDRSPRLGGEGGLTVNIARTLHLHTGTQGDHAVRSGVLRYAVGEGLWMLLCVQGKPSD
jgi:hypothetical protein